MTAATERVISGFNHVVIGVNDLASAVRAYETLLDVRAGERSERDGVTSAMLALGNIGVELMTPVGEGARRLRSAIAERGEGLMSLVFATNDLPTAHRRCERVGLAPESIVEREAFKSFRVGAERTHGVRLFVLQREAPLAANAADVTGLDHVVIRSADMERAAALYGARLGLDMRLDREAMGRRLMFFRCGDAVVEIAPDAPREDGRDRLWGLSWRVSDADAAQTRLAAAGLDVSEVRTGMKPGTRVFTARDGTCGVPTLMIEPASRRD